MPTITTAIITKNEVNDIEKCLKSVDWADEIIVLDSGSTDGTQTICQKYNVKLIETDWLGFGKQKQLALETASSEWVLSLDADEIVSDKLKKEIQQVLAINNNNYVAYKIPRLTFFYGKPIKHCVNPKKDTPIRLIKKGYGKFTHDLVHEKIVVHGNIGILKNMLHHYSFANLTELLDKANSYSTLSAKQLHSKGIKSNVFKVFAHAIWSFIKLYILKGGFLDGWAGFLIAFGNFEGTFYRYAKLIEYYKKPNKKTAS